MEKSHELTMTVLMTPDMANFAGNVHGGTILKLLDQVAYACASRYASRYVVTASVDNVIFRERIHVGELVTFMASVNHSGRSSMEVGIKVIAEDIRSQAQRHVNSCYLRWSPSATTGSRWRCLHCNRRPKRKSEGSTGRHSVRKYACNMASGRTRRNSNLRCGIRYAQYCTVVRSITTGVRELR